MYYTWNIKSYGGTNTMKEILKYVPGFRSNKKWKKVISTIYYAFCVYS